MERREISNILKTKYEENSEKYKYNFSEQTFHEISSKLFESSKHFVSTFDYDFGKGRTPLQKVKNFIKRAIRKSTRFMLQPYAEKMYRFQELNGEITGSLTEYAKYSNNILKYSKREIENSKREIENSKREIENSKREIVAINEEMRNKFTDTHNHLANFENTLWNIIKEKDKVQEELSKYESYSQAGEDKIIEFILSYLGEKNIGLSYLDIGCNDYKSLSNSYALYKKGVRGVLIDANPIYIDEIKMYRPEDIVLNCGIGAKNSEKMKFYILNTPGLDSFDLESIKEAQRQTPWIEIVDEIEVPVYTLDEIYEKYFASVPTIVSLDVEGLEMDILKSTNFEKYRPYIFIIETIEYREKISVTNKRNDIINLMFENDYIEYAFTGVNSIFIDKRR